MKLALGGLLLLAGLVASFPAGYDEPKPVEPKPYVQPTQPPPPIKPYEPPPPPIKPYEPPTPPEKPYVPPPPPPPPDKPYVPPKPQVQPPRYRRESPPAPPPPFLKPAPDSDQSAVKVETLAITDKSGPDTEQVTTQSATIVDDKVQRERRQTKEEGKTDDKKPPHVAVILPAEVPAPPHGHTEKTDITVELTTAGKERDTRNAEEATTQKDLGIEKSAEDSEGTKHENATNTPVVDKVHRERRQTKEEEKDGKKPVILPAEVPAPPHLQGGTTEKAEITTVEVTTPGKVRGARNVEEVTTQKVTDAGKTKEGEEGTKHGPDDGHVHTDEEVTTEKTTTFTRNRRQLKPAPPPTVPDPDPESHNHTEADGHDHKEEEVTTEKTTIFNRNRRQLKPATPPPAPAVVDPDHDSHNHTEGDGHDHKDDEVTTTKTIVFKQKRQAPPAPPVVDPVEPEVDPAEPAVDPAEPADGTGENGEPQEREETGTSQPFDPNGDNPPTDEEKPAGFEPNPETPPKDETGEAEENGRHARQAPETKPVDNATTVKTLLEADCIKESGTCIVFGQERFRCCAAQFKNCCTRPALVGQNPTQ